MALQAEAVADIVAAGLKELNRLRFVDLTSDLQKYSAMRRMMQKEKMRTYDDGYAFQWDVMTGDNGSAEFVGLYSTDNVDVVNVLTQASSTWKHITWNWAIDAHEITMNGGASRIVNLIDTRRFAAKISAVKKFEQAFWTLPSATDTVSPHGVPYWIVKNNTVGFNGGLPSGYTDVGGLSPTTYPRWKNYTGQYTDITKDDLIDKWSTAADKCMFMPPIEGMPLLTDGNAHGYLTTYNVYKSTKTILENQNDDLGMDVDSMDGRPVFRRTPIEWNPVLDVDTTDPVYGIFWGDFKITKLRGWWEKETVIPKKSDQHNVSVTHYDCSFNYTATNRRSHFVLAKDTTLPTIVV